jgi:hypothetical protein
MLPEIGTRGVLIATAVLGYSVLLLGVGYLLGRYRRMLPWRREFAEKNLPAILQYLEEVTGTVDLLRQQLETMPEHELVRQARDLHVAAGDLPGTYYTVLTQSADPYIFDNLPELREQYGTFVRQLECYVRARRDGTPCSLGDIDNTISGIHHLARLIGKQARRVALLQ